MEDVESSTARDAKEDEVETGRLDPKISRILVRDLGLTSVHEKVEETYQHLVPKHRQIIRDNILSFIIQLRETVHLAPSLINTIDC